MGIILRVLILEVSVWISLTIRRGYGFLSGFRPFSLPVYMGIILRDLRLEVSVGIS